ncbi:MAG: hypothetical protein ACRD2C_12915 [Acidimicrobiales bacterium]
MPGTTASARMPRPRRRVLLKDARDNGHYLRATWHPERQMFVVSTWRDEVCTGAVRLPAHASGALAGLVVDGLADSVAQPLKPARTAGGLSRMERRLRDWRRRLSRPKR